MTDEQTSDKFPELTPDELGAVRKGAREAITQMHERRQRLNPLDLYDPDEPLSPEAEEIAWDLVGHMPKYRDSCYRPERLKLAAYLASQGYRKIGPADYTVEYRLTGDPGEGYPPFVYVWRGPKAEEGIWKFHRDHALNWRTAKIEKRTAIDTHWERVLTASTTPGARDDC